MSKGRIDFADLFRSNGFYIKDDDGNEYLDEEKVKNEIGISVSAAEGIIAGYNNPLRGKNYNAVIDYFELDVAQVRAFFRWRTEKWDAWNEAGCPEDTSDPTYFTEEDYDGEYYDEEVAALEPEEEEFSDEDSEDESEDSEFTEEETVNDSEDESEDSEFTL